MGRVDHSGDALGADEIGQSFDATETAAADLACECRGFAGAAGQRGDHPRIGVACDQIAGKLGCLACAAENQDGLGGIRLRRHGPEASRRGR